MKYTNEMVLQAGNAIRVLAADTVEKAKSGHPGVAMGLADIAANFWLKYFKYDPKEVDWADRDRLVFSGGHASSLVYTLFHLAGVGGLKLDELKTFRQVGSRCAGHPERGVMPGVEVTTGPLGQGFAMAVGMAIAERMEAVRWNTDPENPIVDHRTWVFCGDGDLMEGISHEAASLAGRLRLDRLVAIYDSNDITIEGNATLAVADNAKMRFESYGWKVYECDGHDVDSMDRAFRKALKTVGQPVMIIAATHIGKGAPTKQDTAGVHGAPLGADELAALKTALGFDPAKTFDVPGDLYDWFEDRAAAGHRMFLRWRKTQRDWAAANPEKAAERENFLKSALPRDLLSLLPAFETGTAVATRGACGTVMNALAPAVPQFIGGSADLEPSNKTALKAFPWIAADDFAGRNFHFGIRELAMTSIVNGLAAHGGWRPFGATFFVFSDYCRPALRLAALMGLPTMAVFSHDSFYVGEDGPTHEPVEQLAALRAMPGFELFRPADANETGYCWVEMLKRRNGPSCICTTRQNVPVLEGTSAAGVARGAYVIFGNSAHPELLFIASGSEVALCVEAAKRLADEGKLVRVVSMPCRTRFEAQDLPYRESVVPGTAAKRVVVEAGCRFGWEGYAVNAATTRYVTLDTFGASGPYKALAEQYGFTVENVYRTAREML